MGMGIKVTDWQCLHMGKKIITDVFQYALRNINHNSVANQRSNDTGNKYDGHKPKSFQ